ncbi:MAG TPA: AAA family ATPase [Pirellulales bacterium]|nr:AAA family ATPase [Pirellulales bacterium]
MTTFDKIHIQGFRRLHDVDLKLRPLMVLIGANGCGKTSLLDVFSLLAASASGDLNQTMSDLGGIESNLSNLASANGGKSRSMAFDLAMGNKHPEPIRYRVALAARGVGYEIADETLTQPQMQEAREIKRIDAHHGDVHYCSPDGSRIAPNWDYDAAETALSQVPKVYKQPEDFRKRLASSTHYHVLDVSRRAPIRLPQQMRDARLPGHDGADLVSCLYTLRETDPDRYDTVEDTLRAGFPGFERLNFPLVAAGTVAMTWKDATSKQPFYMHQLSEGTLRFLWLVSLLQSPGLSAVTLIDEPEVSLHPELLSLLADLFRESSQRTQLIVATHADRLVRSLQPSEVATIDVNDSGAAEMTWADELDLDQWLDDYTLDEVWRLGRMGGRS